YVPVWSEPIENLVRAMVAKLDDYNPGTLSEDPSGSRDLLKKLYQQLFPKSVRHDLGEYYTPDWLAEHVLNELEYVGDPDKRILDPACGSGTFLVMAINRIRAWYDENRENCSFGEDDLCRKILTNVIGFDLNPLAVMAARTNYLIAMRDLIGHSDKVEIPVYLCDSIMTPSAYGGLFAGTTGAAKELKTAAAKFLIPTEIATNREDVAKYAEQLESCVKNGYSAKEFIERCRDEGLPVSAENLHTDLYTELVSLDKANKNGVWARIIKNAFAPLFTQRADYVAGNPPWVNWESLPADYRNAMKPLWQAYGLFSLSGSEGRLGGGKKDLAMLFLYASVDNYLKDGGKLGFVITQTVFKTKGAGDGFRQFQIIRGDERIIIKPAAVHDLSAMQVFEGAVNRTGTIVCMRAKADFKYPIDYFVWKGPSVIDQDATIGNVLETTSRTKVSAAPVEPGNRTSPWLTAPKKALVGIQRIIGQGAYRAYASCCTWLNGVYWVHVLGETSSKTILIENRHDVGKIKVEKVQASIEAELVYSLIRGRDVSRWKATASTHLILTQDPATRAGIPEGVMKRKYPRAFDYLKKFEAPLRKRSGYRKFFDPTDPFYSVYNVGPHSIAPFRVVWAGEVATSLDAAVVSPDEDGRPILTDQTAYQVPVESIEEADFLCSLLNCLPVRAFYKFVAYKHTSMHFIQQLRFPRFDKTKSNHCRIAALGRTARESSGDAATIKGVEDKIDKAVAELWGIPRESLDAIRDGIRALGGRIEIGPDDDEG
ncbi:MAG: N-6 DNA methylase, partial [Planctomycetota bacterium]